MTSRRRTRNRGELEHIKPVRRPRHLRRCFICLFVCLFVPPGALCEAPGGVLEKSDDFTSLTGRIGLPTPAKDAAPTAVIDVVTGCNRL